jgi:hypothetical protein
LLTLLNGHCEEAEGRRGNLDIYGETAVVPFAALWASAYALPRSDSNLQTPDFMVNLV